MHSTVDEDALDKAIVIQDLDYCRFHVSEITVKDILENDSNKDSKNVIESPQSPIIVNMEPELPEAPRKPNRATNVPKTNVRL